MVCIKQGDGTGKISGDFASLSISDFFSVTKTILGLFLSISTLLITATSLSINLCFLISLTISLASILCLLFLISSSSSGITSTGTLAGLSSHTIAVSVRTPNHQLVHVHFPRHAYSITKSS